MSGLCCAVLCCAGWDVQLVTVQYIYSTSNCEVRSHFFHGDGKERSRVLEGVFCFLVFKMLVE